MKLPAGMTVAAGAPAAGACVRVERPRAGLAVLVIDPPHRRMPVFDAPLLRDLADLLERLKQDDALKGLVITGRAPLTFVAGADVEEIARIADARVAFELARFGQELFQSIAGLRARTVAAVGGPVPGGACELSLACDAIVLADHASTRIGLPEVKLGILPGWGGCQRLPRRVGVPRALDLILNGKLVAPREALRAGLVDRVTRPEYLVAVASRIALGEEPIRRRDRGAALWLVDKNPIVLRAIGAKVRSKLRKETGGHYPAPFAALELVLAAPRTAIEQGLAAEAKALAELAVGDVCKNLISIFRASEDAKKLAKEGGDEAKRLRRIGVIGAGVMGAGIAALAAERGLAARLSDVAREPLDAAVFAHRRRIGSLRARKRLAAHEADAALDRFEVVVGLAGFARCDVVVEAVVEKLDVKRKVFFELARQVAPDAILATNTSSLSVGAIAQDMREDERFAGLHFFNPVARMPLVEIVRGPKTAPWVVGALARLALELGKTPVVVADVAGFLVNRVLGPYLDEAVRLFESGVPVERIDEVAREFGMPMGPLELLDEVGFDVAVHAAQSLEQAYGLRMATTGVLARALEAGLKGKKGGAGFYRYEPRGAEGRIERGGANVDMRRHREAASRIGDHTDSTIQDHLLLAMLNEAARALEDGVVRSPRELDLALVFGIGFPPFRGGLLRWADSLGAADVCARLRRIAGAPEVLSRREGAVRFLPSSFLVSLADHGGAFHSK